MKCGFGQCKETANQEMSVPVGRFVNGELERHESARLPVRLCDYHFFICGTSKFATVPVSKDEYKLFGPYDTVELIEAVMAAREMTRKVQPFTVEEANDIARMKREGQE